ncbi:MAG: DUF924 family protein [Burkholderiaceae bacterium]
MTGQPMPDGAQAVHDFWFGVPGDAVWGTRRAQWFTKSAAFDDEIRRVFGDLVGQAVAGQLDHWADAGNPAEATVSLVLLLDQFTRNIHRDTPAMFAGDERALPIAQSFVAAGRDRRLNPLQRWFVYLPYEHAESLDVQRESLKLFKALTDEAITADIYPWAWRHFEIIERFGRFPHRNAILGRPSTPEETAFLKEPNSSF